MTSVFGVRLGDERPRLCPSEFALDRFRLGELTGTPEVETIATHLGTCLACSERLAGLRAEQAPDLGLMPRLHEGLSTGPKRCWRPIWNVDYLRLRWSLVGVLGGLAMALFWFKGPASNTKDQTVAKGGGAWRLRVHVARNQGSSAVVEPGDTLAPGDKIRFEVTTSWKEGFATVISVDSRGAVTAFAPTSGQAVRVSGRVPYLLDGAVELDDVLGTERLVLFGCREPKTVEGLLAATKQTLARAPKKDPDAFPPVRVAGCEEETLLIRKAGSR